MFSELFPQLGRGVAPADRPWSFVALLQMPRDSCFHLLNAVEVSRSQDFSLQGREYNLDLVEPGRILGQPVNLDGERQPQAFGPAFNLFRGMGRTGVQDEMQDTDVSSPEAGKDHTQELLKIDKTLAREEAGHRFSRMHQESGEKIGDAQPLVATPALQGFAWAGGNNPAGNTQGLDAGLFIRTDEDFPAFGQFLGLLVKIEDDGGSFQKQRVGRLLPGAMLPGLDPILAQPSADGARTDA